MKSAIKKLLPRPFLAAYHRFLPAAASLAYGRPTAKMVVVGVTGTNGKTTVSNMIGRVLEAGGHTVGVTTTANFRIGGRERLNDTKMTMLGRTRLQRMLNEMVQSGCDYAVVETSSEGIKQNRHLDIAYDAAVFTNLTPEHLESHGGFENYKAAKGRLFARLGELPDKVLNGHLVPKVIVANLDSPHAEYFLSFDADKKFGFTRQGTIAPAGTETVVAENIDLRPDCSHFFVGGQEFRIQIPGMFNVENALAAIAAGVSQGVSLEDAARGLGEMEGVPGRMEFIDVGQPFRALVDYAPEPESFRRLYEALAMHPRQRTIHVLGSCGGGRDRDRRPILGELAGRNADIVIVTNEDPYDDDPRQIIEEVAAGARAAGKADGKDLFLIDDRGEAIRRAVAEAAEGDLVVVTGKGSEQAICVADGRKLPWDDRQQLRSAIIDRISPK